ncbi:hypothetical protein HMF8227_02325 [Saliniradius amylolyticus]|uniref:Phage head morphogenesis domain-containing protein n=1 Tax=Saliniradius amylolyticus TaxID=2183582 RepID=A0A2S2E735_9ALTE|nr:hypothetical protein [Saliniradius amylolyticus]AWL12777.1 hypothetical protein HMF8227_02325 [Saliniradius amylolyticus]
MNRNEFQGRTPFDEKMRALYFAQKAAKEGLDFMPYLVTMHQKQLEEIAEQRELGVSHVQIVANGLGGHYCAFCKSIEGRVLDLDDELKAPTLPHLNCQCRSINPEQTGYCLCYYEPVFDDEL